MPPHINTAQDIATPYIQTIYEDAMFIAREQNIMASLVTTFNDRSGLASRSASEYNQATFPVVGESDDLASQAFTPSVISTLTPFERAAQFFITDSRIESDPWNVIQADAARELGSGLANTVERDLVGTFPNLTGGTAGTAGSAMTWGYLANAVAILRANNVPGPYYCVLHPYQAHDLVIATPNVAAQAGMMNAPQAGDRVFQGGLLSGLGAPLGLAGIFTSSNIDVDSQDDAIGAVFSPSAIALDVRRAPRMEPDRDPSRRGIELNISTVYAAGVWRPNYGVKVISDAAVPA